MTPDSQLGPKVSRAEFARSLTESGLLDANVLLPDAPGTAPDGTGAARELIAAGHLTPYQANAVLERRFADLRMGNYEILDQLGVGGMGTVFKARHKRMKRIVALKVLSPEVAATDKFLHRFQREIETIARLVHPNIVIAFDADEGEAGPFLVMEFVDGRDLASEVTAEGPLPVAAAVDRIIQAARGLEYAHSQGVIHRDIKPGNLLRAKTGEVKVADLGLARFRGASGSSGTGSLTQAGMVVGTVEYMSPEQAVDSGTVDQRADVYSLGCTLYFLLTGRTPYTGTSLMGVMLAHRDDPIPSLRTVRPNVPPALEAVFRRMVAKLPEDRPASMTQVILDLERVRALGLPADPKTAPIKFDRTVELSALPPAVPQTDDFDVTSAGAGSKPPGVAGRTAVIAEPSRMQLGLIRIYLQQLGVAAQHTTGSGQEAIELVKRTRADVLISALHLTDMTGAQLVATLRADPDCAGTGFVLATSATDGEQIEGVPHDPRTVVMPKPFDLDKLARAISAVVR
jgi:serine/threonine-protein kinase